MGRSYGAICNECGSAFEVSESSGMIAMPLHCDRCGERWWEFGPAGSIVEDQPAPSFRSQNLRHDPDEPRDSLRLVMFALSIL